MDMDKTKSKNKNQIKLRMKDFKHLDHGLSKIMVIIMVNNQMDSKIVEGVVKLMEIIFKNYQEFKIIFSKNINNKN
jgi:hypothetical protein